MPHTPRCSSSIRRAALRPLAAACILAVAGSPVMAQETVKWIRTFAGDYDVAGNWFPAVVPGPMDTAVLGVLRPDRGYEVRIDQDAAVGWLAFENPLAVVKIEEGATFTVGRATGRGRLIVSDLADVFISRLRLADGATVDADVIMNRDFSTIERAGSGEAPVFGADASIRGQGFLIGDFVVLGEIEARLGRIGFQSGTTTLGPDSIVRAVPGGVYRVASSGRVSGGTWLAGVGDEAGVFDGDGTGGIADTRLEGEWGFEPGEGIFLAGDISGPGNLIVHRDPTAGFTTLGIETGATIGVDVFLSASPFPPSRGNIASVGEGDPAIFLPNTTISGNGAIRGSFEMQGRVEVAGDGAVIAFEDGALSATPDAAFVVDAGRFVF